MSVNQEAVQAALATVIDPEIRRPITEIGMTVLGSQTTKEPSETSLAQMVSLNEL